MCVQPAANRAWVYVRLQPERHLTNHLDALLTSTIFAYPPLQSLEGKSEVKALRSSLGQAPWHHLLENADICSAAQFFIQVSRAGGTPLRPDGPPPEQPVGLMCFGSSHVSRIFIGTQKSSSQFTQLPHPSHTLFYGGGGAVIPSLYDLLLIRESEVYSSWVEKIGS